MKTRATVCTLHPAHHAIPPSTQSIHAADPSVPTTGGQQNRFPLSPLPLPAFVVDAGSATPRGMPD